MADKKISQLDSASTPLTGAEQLAIVQNNETVKATIDQVRGYKVYTAILRETVIDPLIPTYGNPVVTVLENTLGSSITWTRENVGYYYGNYIFTNPSKVFLSMTGNYSNEGFGNIHTVTGEIYDDGSGNKLWFATNDGQGSGADFWGNVPIFIEIRVYP